MVVKIAGKILPHLRHKRADDFIFAAAISSVKVDDRMRTVIVQTLIALDGRKVRAVLRGMAVNRQIHALLFSR